MLNYQKAYENCFELQRFVWHVWTRQLKKLRKDKEAYHLVNSHIAMERSNIVHGKTHELSMAIFSSNVKLPEGICEGRLRANSQLWPCTTSCLESLWGWSKNLHSHRSVPTSCTCTSGTSTTCSWTSPEMLEIC